VSDINVSGTSISDTSKNIDISTHQLYTVIRHEYIRHINNKHISEYAIIRNIQATDASTV